MEKKFIGIEDISAYKRSFELSNYVWNMVIKWNYFEKETIGKQLIRSVDSISANIAEGFYRYHKRDKIHFYYFSKGSVGESKDWIKKTRLRNLISENEYAYLMKELETFPKEINSLIKFTWNKLKK